MQQIHFLVAVAAHRFHAGDAVAVFLDIGLHHLFRMHGRDLQRHPLIAVMEGRNGPGGDELEQDGIAGVDPSKQITKDAQEHHISRKYLLPDGFSGLVGHIEGDKIRSAGGGVSLQRNGRSDSVEKSAENHVQHRIVKQRLKPADFQKKTGQKYLHQRIKGKPFADAAAAQKRHRNVQDEHSQRDGKAPAIQGSNIVDQNGNACKSAGQKPGRTNEHLDDERLHQRRRGNGSDRDDPAHDLILF